MRPDRIPLFPLNVVLLPGAPLPLHIFEPRYLQMLERCIDEESEFGVLLSMPNGVARVGCTAEIMEVHNRRNDGQLDILTVGRAPFRVVRFFSENPLLEGSVDYLEDRDLSFGPPRPDLVELYETCYTLVFRDYPKNRHEDSTKPFSFLVAGTLPLELLWKQQILEVRLESDRQERLAGYLRNWAPHLQKAELVRAQAAGNSNVLN